MATDSESRMARFLSYDLTSAQSRYSSHKERRGNALRAVQSMHQKVIDTANMGDYAKEIDNMTIKRARLDKEVTDCLLLAPKEATLVCIETPQDADKVKIRTDLKPETLTKDATPVELKIWTKECKVFFQSSNLGRGDRIEQQQDLIKLIDSVLAAKVRGKIDEATPVFPEINAAQNMAGKAVRSP